MDALSCVSMPVLRTVQWLFSASATTPTADHTTSNSSVPDAMASIPSTAADDDTKAVPTSPGCDAWQLLCDIVPGPPCDQVRLCPALVSHIAASCGFVHEPGTHCALSTRLSLVLQGTWQGQLCALKLSPPSCSGPHDGEVAVLQHIAAMAAAAGRSELVAHLPKVLSVGKDMQLETAQGGRVRAVVMPWYPMCLLDELVEGRLTAALAWQVVAAASAVLQFAHALGITNCDLKPENVLLTATGHPIVADWNLARLCGQPVSWFGDSEVLCGALAAAAVPRSMRAVPGGAVALPDQFADKVIGTRAYCPPRGFAGNRAADMFRLGAVMFAMLYGTEPVVVHFGRRLLRNDFALTPNPALAQDVAFASVMRTYLACTVSCATDDCIEPLPWQQLPLATTPIPAEE